MSVRGVRLVQSRERASGCTVGWSRPRPLLLVHVRSSRPTSQEASLASAPAAEQRAGTDRQARTATAADDEETQATAPSFVLLHLLSPSAMWRASASSAASSLRVVHATDIHCLIPPHWRQVLSAPKRIVGVTNLYLLRRAERFSLEVQRQLVREIVAQRPDVVILSGDLTNLALAEEFALAREVLHPLLDNGGAFPTFIVPGNHDAYTAESVLDERGVATSSADSGTRGTVAAHMMRQTFGPWMESIDEKDIPEWQAGMYGSHEQFLAQIRRQQQHFMRFRPEDIPASLRTPRSDASAPTPLPYLPVFAYDFLRITGLNPCRPTGIGSNGEYEAKQLSVLEHLLRSAPQPVDGTFDAWRPIDAATQERRERERRTISDDAASASPSLPSTSTSPSSPLPFSSSYNLLVGHYPILDGRGRAYEEVHKWHGVSNGAALRTVLQHPSNLVAPHLFVHGHVHRGFQDQLVLGRNGGVAREEQDEDELDHHSTPRQMLICNSGSSGQSFSAKKKRCAAFNVYTIQRSAPVEPTPEEASEARDPSQLLRPRRTYPFPQPPPPFPSSSRPTPAELAASPFVQSANTSNGARGGIQTVHQPSDDRTQRYLTQIQRWIHDGEQFRPEEFPYTSGF